MRKMIRFTMSIAKKMSKVLLEKKIILVYKKALIRKGTDQG
jgi:hypothetical protein